MKPILFNTEMVRSILEGRKTVTRRAIRPQPEGRPIRMTENSCYPGCYAIEGTPRVIRPPYQPVDILYVRETWNGDWCDHYIYKADGGSAKAAGYTAEPKWRPSIHMPKEAARLFLRVKGVRVERLGDITDDQCEAEGVVGWTKDGKLYKYAPADPEGDGPAWKWQDCPTIPQEAMRRAWDSTIKPNDRATYGWEANPWVWVIEFERISKDEALGGGRDG